VARLRQTLGGRYGGPLTHRSYTTPWGTTSVDQRITAALADGEQPKPFSELRASCRVRTTTLYERLAAMTTAGLVVKSADGYCLVIR
jgi:hypothetical protein